MAVRRGTGRKDYGKDIQSSVIPVTRTHQYRTVTAGLVDLTSLGSIVITNSSADGWAIVADYSTAISASNNIMIFDVTIEFDANVLTKVWFGTYNLVTGAFTPIVSKYGYNKVTFKFPKGYYMSGTELVTNQNEPAISVEPGGYKTRTTFSGLIDELAPSA